MRYFIPTILLTITIGGCLSCQPKNESVAATTNRAEPKKNSVSELHYADTTTAENKELIRRLDSFYKKQASAGFNGSVLIGHKGKILYERYFGFANRERRMELTPESAVQLASVSKTFTAAAILYLHEHKYLDIDERVNKYIPNFPYPDITVKMLLSHRTGLPDYLKWIPLYNKDNNTPVSNDYVLQMFARHKPKLEFTPNRGFKYSNSNYAVLASIIEKVTEMTYPDFMKRYIFEPLGMYNTFVFQPNEGLPDNATISYKYNWVREPVMFADGVYGDKGIYSTVQDMYRWDQSFYKQTILSNETIELAYGPCSFEKPGVRNYGLGWRMFCYPNGDKIIYHNGWWHGNNTVFYRYIQDNYTVVILGNKYNNGIYRQEKPVSAIVNIARADGMEVGAN
jgi:CubicO group peptidase (beta-lactamase class C family)